MGGFDLHREAIGEWLCDGLPWSPHDYIRTPESFRVNDKRVYAQQLTRPLAQQNDMRFIHQTDDGALAVFAERLGWDSDFFGYEIARLNGIFLLQDGGAEDYAGALASLLAHCRARGIRYLFGVVRSEELALIQALSGAGFALIETRLHYHGEITGGDEAKRYPVRLADADDLPDLRRAARMAVNRYDRFHADPFILPADADRMMETWMDASIKTGFADGVLVPRDKPATAFCTLKHNRDDWAAWGYNLAQIPFGAVMDEWRGWYFRLLSEALHALRAEGAQHCFYVTQAANYAAIRVCEKIGFRYGRSEHVFRIIL